jgi:predicted nucleotidyltransferase
MDFLPPANPVALGLHLTDDEWRDICELIKAEPTILEARIYGSRKTGVRRKKAKPEPLDIDVAIEVQSDDPTHKFLQFMDVAKRLTQHAKACGLVLQIEDLTDCNSLYYPDRRAGVRIAP